MNINPFGFDQHEVQLTLPCACGASVAFMLGQGAEGAALICPRCGVNIHLQDRDTSVQRAMLTTNMALRRIRKRIQRLRL
jgi:hypothetical protein